ncbi:MAG: AbrB/MazE/SpoVT family DNA-binding domain-containing protein [Vicinamibacterales bacterium]
MAKVTGKFQVTLPKSAVEECGIQIGDTLVVQVSAGTLRLSRDTSQALDQRDRLAHYDRATRRQQNRAALPKSAARGWTREELYDRGRSR